MNIALIGHGKMGKEVETVAREKGIAIRQIFTSGNNTGGRGLTKESLKDIDVCIDFSSPAAALDNIRAAVSAGKTMAVGTTGWYEHMDEVKALVKEKKTGFLYAANFSLGVNIFSRIVADAAHLFEKHPEYDAAVSEMHHKGKADSPSGTALSLGALIMHAMGRKSELLLEPSHGLIKPHQLHVTSTRVGHATGRHTVVFDSEADTIELVHTAKSRRGYALGAIVAAGWLMGKKGVFTMRDVILE